MRVLFLSQIVPYPPHGGVLQRGYNILRELGREARVHLLAFVHPNLMPTEAERSASVHALSAFCETVECFPLWAKASRVHYAAALAASAWSSRPFSMIAHRSNPFGRRITEIVNQQPPDLIHVDTLGLSPFVDAHRSVPTVLTHHNIESILMERRAQVERRPFAKQYLQRETEKLRCYERSETPKFNVNIVMSSVDQTLLMSKVPGVRTAVVPNGVDVDYFSPCAKEETSALIYTGGMSMFANRDAVLYFLHEIWPLISARDPNVRFFAVGNHPAREALAFAECDPRVVVTGYVDDIRPYVRRSAVYVVPLRVGGGTRLKVLDAMAMGKAMVSTSIGCEGIDIRADEHLLIADTPESFAEATLNLLADPARRRALGRAARDLAEQRYSWRVVGGQLMVAYRAAISNGRRAR